MKIELVEKITFEEKDVFICVKDDGEGGNYKPGDFIMIYELHSHADGMHTLRTSGTVEGRVGRAVGGSVWLREKLKAGLFEYLGNVKQ